MAHGIYITDGRGLSNEACRELLLKKSTCVCTRACTRLTHVKVNYLACIISAACEFGVRTNARGTLDMHDTNMPVTCTHFATVSNTCDVL